VLVRSAGEEQGGRALLLLHDGRASSRVFEPLMRELATGRRVFAPDIPDNGASDPFTASDAPSIADYADAVAEVALTLGLEGPDLVAVGAGAAVALELRSRAPFAESRCVLASPDFYAPEFTRRLAAEWVPPLAPRWDGSHLNQLWLMLRDEHTFWPWFDKSPSGACAVALPTDWREFHARVVDILRSLPTYHRLTAAALDFDWAQALRRLGDAGVTLVTANDDPRRPHVSAAAELAGLPSPGVLPASVGEQAGEILRILRTPERGDGRSASHAEPR